jgi:mono/diheme cytochrome c family protein
MLSEREPNHTMKKITYTLFAIGTTAMLFTACIKDNPDSPGWEYFPDMYRGQGPEPNGVFVNSVSPDSMSNRLPAEGSIPRGFTPFPYANDPMGDTLASKFWMNPNTVNDKYEDEGKFLYERFCVYCHGVKGDGEGALVTSKKYSSTPPNYMTIAGRLTDGHVYHVITYGKNAMGSHASQLSPEERWKVVAYVQRLSRGGTPKSETAKPSADTMKVVPPTEMQPPHGGDPDKIKTH